MHYGRQMLHRHNINSGKIFTAINNNLSMLNVLLFIIFDGKMR